MLLVLAPKLWRGTRRALSLAIAVLVGLAILNVLKGLDFEETALDLVLVAVLVVGRRSFSHGCRTRPRLAVVGTAVAVWALTYTVMLVGPLVADRGHTTRHTLHPIRHAVHHLIAHAVRAAATVTTGLSHNLILVSEVLIGCAVAITLVAVRSSLRAASARNTHSAADLQGTRALVERFGVDSLSPFVLRPDKAFHFHDDGVLAYQVIGDTAIVSGDPIGPPGIAPRVLRSFRDLARERGWQVVVWGASARHVTAYRELGLRSMCLGEEAFVDPSQFTLEGRAVRKLRQSVHRLERRGWAVTVCDGQDLAASDAAEIAVFEEHWRQSQPKVLGFAMSMGAFTAECRPRDLYLLARSPEGELRAVMHFVEYCGNLSLDTMHQVGDTPNGLNEALICHALATARERGVAEVSLNYAGLGHIVRHGKAARGIVRLLTAVLSKLVGERFRMAGLVRFDEKFPSEWRPRYLVYESRLGFPRVALRVLQAEGYLPHRDASGPARGAGMPLGQRMRRGAPASAPK